MSPEALADNYSGTLSPYIFVEHHSSKTMFFLSISASDIWSIGCLMVEMAYGEEPFANSSNELAIIYRIGMGEVNLKLPPSFSEEAHEFLSRCLILDANTRPTAAELLDDPFLRSDTESDVEQLQRYTLLSLSLYCNTSTDLGS